MTYDANWKSKPATISEVLKKVMLLERKLTKAEQKIDNLEKSFGVLSSDTSLSNSKDTHIERFTEFEFSLIDNVRGYRCVPGGKIEATQSVGEENWWEVKFPDGDCLELYNEEYNAFRDRMIKKGYWEKL